MLNAFLGIFEVFWNFLKYPIFIIIIFLLFFICTCLFWLIVYFIKGHRFKKGKHNIVKEHSFIYKLFYQLPQRIILDIFERDPSYFKYQGCIIFEGRQGQGKTISMAHFINHMQKEYPLSKCISNFAYKNENDKLTHWKQLLTYKNDIYGVIVGIDELQNWFSSKDSKDFPPEMLEVVTQNRKNRRIILGTAQNFYLISKAIRSQATELRRCTTLFGALTIVRRFEPILDSEGGVKEFRSKGHYFFVHTKELRESYDTYKVIERLSKVGFQEKPNENVSNTFVNILNSKK